MTQEEFLVYLDGFNKNPGEYTVDEVSEIAIKYRNTTGRKDWSALSEALGLNKTGEALRIWAYRQEQLQQNVNKYCYNYMCDDTDIDNETVEPETNTYEELYKEKTQIRDIWNAYRKGLRKDARFERILDTIKQTVAQLNELPKYEYREVSKKGQFNEAAMMLSDLHIGVECNSFYNTYNYEIAKERVSKYVSKTIEYCKNNDVKRLVVLNLGDAIQGIIHENARIEAEEDAVTSTMIAAEIIAEALNKLKLAAPQVIYRSCIDNHSRLKASKEENVAKENLSRIIDWFLKMRLQGSGILFPEDNLDYSIGRYYLMNGKLVIFTHGNNDSKNQAFQNYVGATREYVDYVLMGHYHSGQMKAYQGCKVFINGNVSGTEDFALDHRLFSDPEQTLLVFKDNDVIAYNINLK